MNEIYHDNGEKKYFTLNEYKAMKEGKKENIKVIKPDENKPNNGKILILLSGLMGILSMLVFMMGH